MSDGVAVSALQASRMSLSRAVSALLEAALAVAWLAVAPTLLASPPLPVSEVLSAALSLVWRQESPLASAWGDARWSSVWRLTVLT